MFDTETKDILENIQQLIGKPGERFYWYDFPWANKMIVVHYIKGKCCGIELPKIRRYGQVGTSKWVAKKMTDAEITRVTYVWNEFYNTLKDRLEQIECGSMTIEEALSDGIEIIKDDVKAWLLIEGDEGYGISTKGLYRRSK